MNQTIIETADHSDGTSRIVEKTMRQQLDALVASVDADMAERRQALAKAEAAAVIDKAIYQALPETLPFTPKSLRVGGSVYRADAEMVFEITSRTQVADLLDALPGLPVVLVKAGTTAFIPEVQFVEKDKQGATITPIGEVVYRISTTHAFLQEEYYWWTMLADNLVRVTARTFKAQGIEAKVYPSSSRVGLAQALMQTTWYYENLPAGKLQRWHGGDHQYVVPLTVHQERGASFRAALDGKQSATAKVSSRDCGC